MNLASGTPVNDAALLEIYRDKIAPLAEKVQNRKDELSQEIENLEAIGYLR